MPVGEGKFPDKPGNVCMQLERQGKIHRGMGDIEHDRMHLVERSLTCSVLLPSILVVPFNA